MTHGVHMTHGGTNDSWGTYDLWGTHDLWGYTFINVHAKNESYVNLLSISFLPSIRHPLVQHQSASSYETANLQATSFQHPLICLQSTHHHTHDTLQFFPQLCLQFASSLPPVCLLFASSLPPVYPQFASSLPPVCL